ncbi:COG4189 Predicted transcriptional regulator [Fimbriimonadaceae bacterium]
MQHHIKELSAHESVALFRALGSSTRARIIELLAERELNIGELSLALGLTQPSVTKHIQILEEAGIVVSDYIAAPQGTQKRCRCVFERLLVDLAPKVPVLDGFAETEVPVGMYTDVDVRPTCGLATKEKFIGLVDAPVSFFLPERSQAEILWSAGGWVQYAFPNTIPVNCHIKSIELVMELGSEAPGYNNQYPSDITIWVNEVEVGTWTSPGDFGGSRGQLNPSWYPDNMNQWGVLKTWLVDTEGGYIDGFKISEVKIDSLNILPWAPTKVRIGVKPDAKNQGGFTLYGRSFGNYQLGLILRVRHETAEQEAQTKPKRKSKAVESR